MAMPMTANPRRVSHSMPNINRRTSLLYHHHIPKPAVRTLTPLRSFSTLSNTYFTAGGPFGRCPNEIIIEIFCILHEQTHHNGRWVRILQVCKHWLAVAQGVPTLWTRISANHSHASLARFLRASADYPLETVIHPRRHTDVAAFMDAVGLHSHRIEVLSATLPWSDDFRRLIASSITIPLPRIRDVDMMITHPSSFSEYPHTFPIDCCPTIQSLRLTNIDVVFNGRMLSSLTKLGLETVKSLPSLTTLLAILQAAPELHDLELSGPCRDAHLDTVAASALPIQLPHLKRMVLRSDPEFPRELLSVICTPTFAEVIICLPVITLRGVTPLFLCNALPDQQNLSNIGGIDHINGLTLQFHGAAPSIMGFRVGDDCKRLFSIMLMDTTFPHGKTPNQSVVESIAQAIHFLGIGDRIMSVEITGDDKEEHRLDLLNVFRALPNLKALSIRTPCMTSVLSALTSPQHPTQPVCVCPGLTDIQLQDIEFDDGLVVNMLDCFERRGEMGAAGLRYLALCRSRGLDGDQVVMLEGIVDRLKCRPDPRC